MGYQQRQPPGGYANPPSFRQGDQWYWPTHAYGHQYTRCAYRGQQPYSSPYTNSYANPNPINPTNPYANPNPINPYPYSYPYLNPINPFVYIVQMNNPSPYYRFDFGTIYMDDGIKWRNADALLSIYAGLILIGIRKGETLESISKLSIKHLISLSKTTLGLVMTDSEKTAIADAFGVKIHEHVDNMWRLYGSNCTDVVHIGTGNDQTVLIIPPEDRKHFDAVIAVMMHNECIPDGVSRVLNPWT